MVGFIQNRATKGGCASCRCEHTKVSWLEGNSAADLPVKDSDRKWQLLPFHSYGLAWEWEPFLKFLHPASFEVYGYNLYYLFKNVKQTKRP